MGDERFENEDSFAGDVLEQLAERLAKRKDLSEVVSSEVRACAGSGYALAADLNDSNDLGVQENRRADHLLDGFGGFGVDFDAFKYRGVTRSGKIIVDLGPAVARGSCREGRIAGQRNESDLFKRFRDEKMQMPPAPGNRQDGHFIAANAQAPGDFLRHGRNRNLRGAFLLRGEGVGDALHL